MYHTSNIDSAAVSDFDISSSKCKHKLTHNINFECLINAETVDKCIHELKLGKVSESDCLSAEHLLHSHPLLVRLLIVTLEAWCFMVFCRKLLVIAL